MKSSCAIKSSIYCFKLELKQKLNLEKLLRTNKEEKKTRFCKALFPKGKFKLIELYHFRFVFLCGEFNDIHRLSVQSSSEKTSKRINFQWLVLLGFWAQKPKNIRKSHRKLMPFWCLFDVFLMSFQIEFWNWGCHLLHRMSSVGASLLLLKTSKSAGARGDVQNFGGCQAPAAPVLTQALL